MVSFDTIFPADSLEFCPTTGFQDIFVCGTYKLLDQYAVGVENSSRVPQRRKGQCLAFRMTPNESEGICFKQMQSIDLPAVPDMKWCHRSSSVSPLLGIADSEGNITLHEWREELLHQIDSIRCAPLDTLCLSLDWSNRRTGGTNLGSLVVSLSNGSLCLLVPTEGSALVLAETWKAHDFEPWIAAWNYWDSSVIYSGGDDLKLKSWDIRQGFNHPTFINKKFEAGVTSIQSHPHLEHVLAVGSYNDTVQIFDIRKMATSVGQIDVGGGVWRLKWHPSGARKQDLLVAYMHDGFKVIRFEAEGEGTSFSGGAQLLKRHDEHESMAYGADWSHAPPLANGNTIVGGCSFYDHKLSLWLS